MTPCYQILDKHSIISLFSNVIVIMTSCYQILGKHAIVYMFLSKWTSYGISHLNLHLQCDIALRNTFSQKKSTIVYRLFQLYRKIIPMPFKSRRSSWSWSYGSWIYNYLCNQWLSPITMWVWTPFMTRCTGYNIMW